MFQGLFVPLHPLPKRDPWFVDFLTFWPLVPWGLWGFSNRTAGARLRGIHEFHTFHGTQIGTRVPLEMTILEKGSLLRNYPEKLALKDMLLSLLLRDCIKQLTFWVVPNRKFREEAKKMQRFQPIGFWLSWISTLSYKNHLQLVSFCKTSLFGDDLICYCCLVRIPIFKIDPYLSSRRSSSISLEFYYIDPQDCKKGTYQPGTCLAIGMPIYDVLPLSVSPCFQEKMMAVTMQS